MEVKVTQADREAGAGLATLAELKDRIRLGEADGSHYAQVCARHRISSQAELIEALEPFAKAADGRKDKGIYGAVCFQQHYLLKARAALAKAKGEA